jgi:hypothetical protein
VKHDRRSPQSVRNTTLWLVGIALAIYVGFILLGAIRG